MAIDLTDKTIISLGNKQNKIQGRFLIPADAVADKPGLLFLGNVDGSGTVGNGIVIWADNTGAIRYSDTIPTDEDADGTAISGAGSGATAALDNIASCAINTSLLSDTDNTDDLGSSSYEWKDLYIDGVGYIDDLRADVAELGDATQTDYIKVADNGVLTMEGGATIDGVGSGNLVDKSAAEIITGGWDITTADLEIKEDSRKVCWGAAGSTDSYIQFDGTDLIFYDSNVAGTVTLAQLQSGTTLNPVISGNLSLPDGTFNWTDSTDETAAAWSFANTGAGADIAITSAMTTGECIKITADATANGSIILLDADGGVGAAGFYLECYDGAATDLTIGDNGEINIKGNAATDILTIDAGHLLVTAGNITATLGNILATAGNITATLGNVVITDGNLDMNEGKIEVDTTSDEISYIKRNNATGTGPAFEIEETHVTGGVGLLVDHNVTDAIDAVQITHDATGGGYGLSVIGTGADSSQALFQGPASQTTSSVVIDGTTGSWIGGAAVGMLHLKSDGAVVADGSLLHIASAGQPAAANDGVCADIVESGAAQATSYAVRISSTNNEALHVDAGKVLVDETITASLGVVTLALDTDVSNPPTDAEIDAVTGADTEVDGCIVFIDDAGAHANAYLCVHDGTKWWQLTMTACA